MRGQGANGRVVSTYADHRSSPIDYNKAQHGRISNAKGAKVVTIKQHIEPAKTKRL